MLTQQTHIDLQSPCSCASEPQILIDKQTNPSFACPIPALTNTCRGFTRDGKAALFFGQLDTKDFYRTSNSNRICAKGELLGQLASHDKAEREGSLRHPGQIRRDLLVQETVVTRNVDHLISDTVSCLQALQSPTQDGRHAVPVE